MTAKLMSSVCVIKCGVDTIKKKIKKYTFLSRDDKPFQWKPVKIVWKDQTKPLLPCYSTWNVYIIIGGGKKQK